MQAFEGMEEIDFGVAAVVAEADDRFFDGRFQRQLDLWDSPSDRQRGAGHEAEAHFFRCRHHLGRFFVIVRQMFVTEDGDGFARFLENLDDLLKKFVTRVEDLTKLVHGVVAVLDDEGDGIDVELAGAG